MSNLAEFDEQKRADIEALLARPLLARLATANPDTLQPHVVPVWFDWDGQFIWISSFSSTRKNRELLKNPRCAVLVEPEPGQSGLQAVLIEGPAELIIEPRSAVEEMARRIYTRYMGEAGVLEAEPQSWIYDPENVIIKLAPERLRAW